MPGNSERPFGGDTLKLHAAFVPEDTEELSHAEVVAAVGLQPLTVPAVLVADGGQPPGHPYVSAGEFEFRPDEDGETYQVIPSWLSRQAEEAAASGQTDGTPWRDAALAPRGVGAAAADSK